MIQFKAERTKDDSEVKIVLTLRCVPNYFRACLLLAERRIERTSGTEPKVGLRVYCTCTNTTIFKSQIKYYLEGRGKDATAVTSLLPKVIVELADLWLEAGKHHLIL
jgi:hypothetical protein